MGETVLAKPLSGPEAVEAILYDIRHMLMQDANFAPHCAISGLSYTVSVKCNYITGWKEEKVSRTVVGERGDGPMASEQGETIELEVKRDEEPPNETRMDTEQPIPVLVTDAHNNTREEYKSYVGKDARGKNALPKQSGRQIRNIVKGNS